MAASRGSDSSSGSPDRVTYPGGLRGTYAAAPLSGSTREGTISRGLATVPSMSINPSTLRQEDLASYFHDLPVDAKLLPASQKIPSQVDIKKSIISALGISILDPLARSSDTKMISPSSVEDLKRVKASLHDHSVRERDRVKTLIEVISKFDKRFLNSVPTKRTWSDVQSSDRSAASPLVDRTIRRGSMINMGIQRKAVSNGFGIDQHKVEDKTKNVVPNKRTRSSLPDVEIDLRASVANAPMATEKNKELLLKNTAHSDGNDQIISNGMDGWEKSRMKKRRSGLKSDFATNKLVDGEQKSKRDTQRRLGNDVRTRSSTDHGFRSNASDNCISVNITPTTKLKLAARESRSGLSATPKLPYDVQQSVRSADECQLAQSTNKFHVVEANNYKCKMLVHSSSPPIAQWVGKRTQKIPRAARRSNLVPPISSHVNSSVSDTVANIASNENDLGCEREPSGTSVQKIKSIGDHFFSAALSENVESGGTETISVDKNKKYGKIKEKGGHIHEVVNVLPKTNEALNEELGLGHCVRKRGRTVRGSTSLRPSNPLVVEKLENAVTGKQLRSTRYSIDQIESKEGRRLPKKLSDRKPYTRSVHAVNNEVFMFHGEINDDREELMTAAKEAMDFGNACSSQFWRQMELIFGLVSAEDIAYLKGLAEIRSSVLDSTSEPDWRGDFRTIVNEEWSNEGGGGTGTHESKSVKDISEQSLPGRGAQKGPSLCQTVIAALIPEEDHEEFSCNGYENFDFDMCGSGFEQDRELNHDGRNHHSLGNGHTFRRPVPNGYGRTNTSRDINKTENNELKHHEPTDDLLEKMTNYSGLLNSLSPDGEAPTTPCTRYNEMSMDEKLLLELQSIGIFPEPVSESDHTEDEEITNDIRSLEEKIYEQELKKKHLLSKLDKYVAEAKQMQERELEHRAFDKLIGVAFDKYMACWGPNPSCGRGLSGKLTKQATLAFLERTLKRCKMFEASGKSCFKDPVFMDVFHSVSPLIKNAKLVASITESAKENGSSKASLGSRHIHTLISQSGQDGDSQVKLSSNDFQSAQLTEHTSGNKVKKRELLLDEVGGTGGMSLRTPSGHGSSLLCGAKGKSGRDKEAKQAKGIQCGSGPAKIGTLSSGNFRGGGRKPKPKNKQKMTQSSTSVNNLRKASEQPEVTLPPAPEYREMLVNGDAKENGDSCLDTLHDSEALDLSNLQIPDMDAWGVPDDINEDGLQENDFVGLQIPMDNLSDLNMIM